MSELRVRADLAAVPSYKQGRSVAPDSSRTVFKVSSNENPYPPLPSVVAAVGDALSGINRYPESAASALTAAVAERFGVADENIVFGAGSVESVSQLMRATAGPGDEILFAWRSFEAYPMLARAAGAEPVQVPLTATHAHDLDAMLRAITDRTRLIIVCNPNNPTGTTIGDAELRGFLDRVPNDIVVLIDEAYLQFNGRSDSPVGVDYFHAYPNVVVAHTFSKAYGLAGLRVGYAIAPTPVASAMRKVAMPFGVTSVAQTAALASLDAEDELTLRVDSLVEERERIVTSLNETGWTLPETQTNFLWFPLGDHTSAAMDVFDEHGLLVRGFPGEGLRATIAESEANDRLLLVAAELVERGLAPHSG